MHNVSSVLMVGGPDAGKTNFLTKLWLQLQSRVGTLEADGQPDDAEYLNANAQALLGGTYAGRTSKNVHVENVVPVRWADQAGVRQQGTLVIPDCSGEEWKRIHQTREWPDRWDKATKDVSGCLVFVRAGSDEIVAPLDWVNCHHLFGKPVELPGPTTQDGTPDLPTQVVLIDWLQFLRSVVGPSKTFPRRLKIGLVISAWDKVPVDLQDQSPGLYVEQNFRMLSDFMASNESHFEFTTFGVSVTGGDLQAAPGYRDEYLKDPYSAGYVVTTLLGEAQRLPDHTLPVAWAMGVPVTCWKVAGRSDK
jgi:hypothetical protein